MHKVRHQEHKRPLFFATLIIQRTARQRFVDKAVSSVEIWAGQTVLALYWFEWGFDDKVVL